MNGGETETYACLAGPGGEAGKVAVTTAKGMRNKQAP
jgi:hypothetical protein